MKYLIGLLIGFILAYSVTVFSTLEFDVLLWDSDVRFLMAFVALIFALVVIIILFLNEQNNEQ